MNTREVLGKCILLLVGIYFFSTSLIAQQAITGRITDAEDGLPVSGASIFIANTTVGTTSSEAGNYSLTFHGTGSFEIVVSHVGYQSVFYKIETPKEAHQYNVALKTNELEEVNIRAAKTYKNRDVDLFWRILLGEKPSRNGIEVLNPEKVYFYLNNENVLTAMIREPIEIVNHQMGYRIRYVLESFRHNYQNNETVRRGKPFFEEMTPQNNRQKERWGKNRQEVYAVSFNRFLRALYKQQIHEEGFLLMNKALFVSGITNPVNLQSIMQPGHAVQISIRAPLILICYGNPINNQIIRKSFDDIIQLNKKYPMVDIMPQQITIYSDGSYSGLLEVQEYSESLFGLSKILPVEYAMEYAMISTFSQYAEIFGGVEKKLSTQLELYPQEKIHLHTDRDFYISGEKIWFKAYLVDAQSHISTNVYTNNAYSHYVYVELISPSNSLVSRVMISRADDMYHGNLSLLDNLPEGNYTLRAYTRYMENMGDDYFFKKNIRIGNPAVSKTKQQQADQSQLNSDDFDVAFYPEGGNIPEGVLWRVAFKAVNKDGNSEKITGIVTDESGVEMITVETHHSGMGIFDFIPELGKKYYLKCRNTNGVEKQFELPQPSARAYSLIATTFKNEIDIGVHKSGNAPGISCYLLAHSRGTVLYFDEWDFTQEFVSFLKEDFPAGVIQFILFDEQMNPLSERLIFSNNEAEATIEFQTDKDVYQIREKVSASLQSSSFSERAGEGLSHFSIAVTDDHDIAVNESTTILSSLLLSSELKGYIENPAYYLHDDVALDLLMMTHGWRRYNIPEVVKGNFEEPQIPFQMFQGISGQVRNLNSRRTVPDSEVLIMEKNGGAEVLTTDRNGSFCIPELDFPDSTTFVLRALNRNGRKNIRLIIDHEIFPISVFAPLNPITSMKTEDKEKKDESVIGDFIEKAVQRAKFDEDVWYLQLEEIAITAKRVEREARTQFWANKSSDKTISRDDIEKYKFSNRSLIESISMFDPGIRVSLNGADKIVVVRGNFSSEVGSVIDGRSKKIVPALLVVDGIAREDENSAWEMPMSNIESIDVFKGASAVSFGMRGANGVISVTTRRGGNPSVDIEKHNQVVYTPLGYQRPVEFYSPKYETLQAKRSAIPDLRTTIYWKPDIVISEDGKVSFEFYTSDFRTTYSVVIEGITSDGRMVRQVEKIRVE